MSNEQQDHLERVSEKIAEAILGFCAPLNLGDTFHMEDLVRHVQSIVPETAPDSSSRILRDLRAKGRITYEVVSRRDSLYRICDSFTPSTPTSGGTRQTDVPTTEEIQAALEDLRRVFVWARKADPKFVFAPELVKVGRWLATKTTKAVSS